jgi:hypothetical protein
MIRLQGLGIIILKFEILVGLHISVEGFQETPGIELEGLVHSHENHVRQKASRRLGQEFGDIVVIGSPFDLDFPAGILPLELINQSTQDRIFVLVPPTGKYQGMRPVLGLGSTAFTPPQSPNPNPRKAIGTKRIFFNGDLSWIYLVYSKPLKKKGKTNLPRMQRIRGIAKIKRNGAKKKAPES